MHGTFGTSRTCSSLSVKWCPERFPLCKLDTGVSTRTRHHSTQCGLHSVPEQGFLPVLGIAQGWKSWENIQKGYG